MQGRGHRAPDPMFDGWDLLDRQERRARRFARWRAGHGVDFVSGEVRNAYQERVQLLIDAITLKKPARVPVGVAVGFYVGVYGGLSKRESMYDYSRSAAALLKYHEDFAPDFQGRPVAPAGVFEKLGLSFVDWPGNGLPDETPWQYLEGEYMKAEEYDTLIADPEDYFRRSLLPRFGSAFAPLAALGPFSDLVEAGGMPFNILPFADPAVAEGVQRLAGAARDSLAWLKATRAAEAEAEARLGIPPEFGGSGKAPYDILADTLRGTKGIMIDRFRLPEKIIEAAERFVPLVIDSCIRQTAFTKVPLVFFWLHKGADGFMSVSDYREFYWPTLKAVILGLVDQGIVPVMFVQGSYNKRLDVIADPEIPVGSVLWWFDQTDMAAAREAFAGQACIAGNVPSALLALAPAHEVEQYVTRLLDTCARDGGFFLRNGASLDDARPENLRAMIETGRGWRG